MIFGKTERLLAEFARERQEWTEERRELLSRIQRPDLIPVRPVEHEDPEPPKDSAELAFVGQEVPEFVQVGHVEESHG